MKYVLVTLIIRKYVCIIKHVWVTLVIRQQKNSNLTYENYNFFLIDSIISVTVWVSVEKKKHANYHGWIFSNNAKKTNNFSVLYFTLKKILQLYLDYYLLIEIFIRDTIVPITIFFAELLKTIATFMLTISRKFFIVILINPNNYSRNHWSLHWILES